MFNRFLSAKVYLINFENGQGVLKFCRAAGRPYLMTREAGYHIIWYGSLLDILFIFLVLFYATQNYFDPYSY